MKAEVLMASTVFDCEIIDAFEQQLDIYTDRADRPPHERYSTILDLILGIGGLTIGLVGEKIGVGPNGRTVAAIIGGKFLGRIARNYIVYYAAKPKTSSSTIRLEISSPTPFKVEVVKEQMEVTTPAVAEVIAF